MDCTCDHALSLILLTLCMHLSLQLERDLEQACKGLMNLVQMKHLNETRKQTRAPGASIPRAWQSYQAYAEALDPQMRILADEDDRAQLERDVQAHKSDFTAEQLDTALGTLRKLDDVCDQLQLDKHIHITAEDRARPLGAGRFGK